MGNAQGYEYLYEETQVYTLEMQTICITSLI